MPSVVIELVNGWCGEFPSMIFNFLCNSTRVLCYTNIMLST